MKETDMATVEPKEAGVVRAWRARGSSCGWGRKGRQRPHRTIQVVLGIWVFYSNINENLMKPFVSLECFWGFVGGSGLPFVCLIILAMISFAFWKDHSDFLIEKDWREQVGLELEGEGGTHQTYRLRTGGCAETTVPRAAQEGRVRFVHERDETCQAGRAPWQPQRARINKFGWNFSFQEHQAQQLQQLHLAQGWATLARSNQPAGSHMPCLIPPLTYCLQPCRHMHP